MLAGWHVSRLAASAELALISADRLGGSVEATWHREADSQEYSIIGSVVECSPATREARVLIPG